MRIGTVLALLGICSLLAPPLAAARTLGVPPAYTPVIAGFVGGETSAVEGTDGRWHVVYELWLTNARPVPATLQRIEVLDYDHQARELATFDGTSLTGALRDLAGRPVADATLAPDTSKLLFVELAFDKKTDVPDAIVHRLSGNGGASPAAREAVAMSYLVAPWDLSERAPIVLGRPLEGGGWVAMNGCCLDRGAHRAAVMPIDGHLRLSQRFAIDWMRIGEDGRFVTGDPANVNDYLSYDQRVVAVAAGKVVEVLDGLDDQLPGSLPDPATITIANVDGNHVIIEIAPGTYVFYAHLKKDSIRVKQGDVVVPGQDLARLGNTGNTSAPHLHLHVMTTPSALAGDGLPYVYRQLSLQGTIDRAQWDLPESGMETAYRVVPEVKGATAQRHDELPLDLQIVDFGFESGPSGTKPPAP